MNAKLLCAMAALLLAAPALAGEHPGKESIQKTGYKGPETCEECHPGTAKAFLDTVHWKHASKVTNVDGIDPNVEYGMLNRVYTMCNGNDIVNNLKETPANSDGKTKLTGCNTCHPGDHINDVASTGASAESSVDCLLCHSAKYDYRKRTLTKDAQGRAVIGQDRSLEAALEVGKPGVKNCTICHETAGGGFLIKRGFLFNKTTDAHAAKGMTCADCHKGKDHKFPTGYDPNNWANDGARIACADCHKEKVHKDADYNNHIAKVACQTCHIPRSGGAYAKNFLKWTKLDNKFYEPTTLGGGEPNDTVPVYAWYNNTVANTPEYIGPKGSRTDGKSKITPFKLFEGQAYYDRKTGQLLSMDFAQPMATGDTLAGVASAAKTLGIKEYEPVAGWQKLYFGNNHLVTKTGALTCQKCHIENGVLHWKELGYDEGEVKRLTSTSLWFEKLAAQKKDEW